MRRKPRSLAPHRDSPGHSPSSDRDSGRQTAPETAGLNLGWALPSGVLGQGPPTALRSWQVAPHQGPAGLAGGCCAHAALGLVVGWQLLPRLSWLGWGQQAAPTRLLQAQLRVTVRDKSLSQPRNSPACTSRSPGVRQPSCGHGLSAAHSATSPRSPPHPATPPRWGASALPPSAPSSRQDGAGAAAWGPCVHWGGSHTMRGSAWRRSLLVPLLGSPWPFLPGVDTGRFPVEAVAPVSTSAFPRLLAAGSWHDQPEGHVRGRKRK